MELAPYFKAVLEADYAPVVICDTEHIIIYMNAAAIARYANRGGAGLLGRNLKECHSPKTGVMLDRIVAWMKESPDHNCVFEGPGTSEDKDVFTIALRDDAGELIGYYEKHEYRTRHTGEMFAELG